MIGFLITLLVPSLKRSMELASTTICMHNLREIGTTLMTYRVENEGWLPSVEKPAVGLAALEPPDPWFVKLFPTYLNDPLIFTCPADPYRFRMMKMGGRLDSPDLADAASYGISQFIMTAGDGFLANVERRRPSRPHETILLADMGPDDFIGPTRRTLTEQTVTPRTGGPSRNDSLLAWDDGFDPFAQKRATPWLTGRHNGGINVLTLEGGVRTAKTSKVMRRPMERYYTACAAGDCTFCNIFHRPHYSFAKDRLFWWTGPVPSE
jgi:hypothetical protein